MPCSDTNEPDPGGNPEPTDTPNLFVANEQAEATPTGRKVRFVISASPASHVAQITVQYATSNGTATAGSHYTATSGTATIPVGDATAQVDVPVIENENAAGTQKQFTFTLSNESANADIADGVATGTIRYDDPDPGETGVIWKRQKYTSVKLADVPVYNQFDGGGPTGDSHAACETVDTPGCTGYTGTLVMSILEFKRFGRVRFGFQPRRLLTDSGYIVGDSEYYDSRIIRQLRIGTPDDLYGANRPNGTQPAGALSCDGDFRRQLDQMPEISTESQSFGTIAERHKDLLLRIKKRVVQNHCVYVSSIWYSSLWNSAAIAPYGYMRHSGAWGAGAGHSYVIVGWNNDVTVKGVNIGGAFLVQSSHGPNWSGNGRSWLPYAHIKDSFPGGGGTRRRTSSMGDPWFRFFYPTWQEAA